MIFVNELRQSVLFDLLGITENMFMYLHLQLLLTSETKLCHLFTICTFFSLLYSAINSVTTVSVDYSCSSGSVTATWDVVFGASLYRATAVDGTSASSNCTSASTSCQISMLKCGEKYEVRVTALSGDCSSTSNISSIFETGEGSGCENKYDLSEAHPLSPLYCMFSIILPPPLFSLHCTVQSIQNKLYP